MSEDRFSRFAVKTSLEDSNLSKYDWMWCGTVEFEHQFRLQLHHFIT